VRNTITHGWPLWPFSSGPTGDPITHTMSLFSASFASRAVASVRVLHQAYVIWLAGGLAMLAGLLLLAAPTRSRAARIASAVALAAWAAWALAPYTGLARLPQLQFLAGSTIRYTLSALGATVLALALAARDGGIRRRRLVIALFLAAIVWSIVEGIRLGYPQVPTQGYLLAGAAAAALVGAIAPKLDVSLVTMNVGRIAAAGLAVAFLALSAPGWLWRESYDGSYEHALLGFMLTQPGFSTGRQPISFAPSVVASLAGWHLTHAIELIPAREPCAQVRARLRTGWVVLFPGEYEPRITTPFDAPSCLAAEHPIYDGGGVVVYGHPG
jgi:hypothetical protein